MSERLYVFDFDNTLVNTAVVIKEDGYDYDFDRLQFYRKMLSILIARRKRNCDVLILSCRSKIWKEKMKSLLQNYFESDLQIILVTRHFVKWVYLHFLSLRYKKIIVVDDMMRREESGTPTMLFYPRSSVRKIKYVVGDRVIKIRGFETL